MADSDQKTTAHYTGFCVFCGIALIVGFFMPIVTKGFGVSDVELQFINIDGLEEDSVPGLLKFLLIYPIIAAVAAFVLIGIKNAIARNISFIVIGVIPLILMLVDDDAERLLQEISGPLSQFTEFDWRLVVALVAWLGILSASFCGKQRPSALFALIAGVVGACAFALTQLIPVEIGFESIVPAAIPFKMIGETGAGSTQISVAVLLIAKLALGATAAILALCQFSPGAARRTRYRLMGAFWIMAALVVFLMPMVIVIMNMGDDGGWELLAGFTATLKVVALFLPFFLMIPYGIGGLGNMGLADVAPERAHAEHHAPEHVHYHNELYAAPAAAPAAALAAAPAASPPEMPAAPRTVEERLAELQRLFEGGLITEDELNAKREKILEDL